MKVDRNGRCQWSVYTGIFPDLGNELEAATESSENEGSEMENKRKPRTVSRTLYIDGVGGMNADMEKM